MQRRRHRCSFIDTEILMERLIIFDDGSFAHRVVMRQKCPGCGDETSEQRDEPVEGD